ncbi:MAG: DUF1080 domain-containing protein [Planctomycetaceae bacterium]|nr:DUF1080 domain-containing protein [Planctomycetaceae bacterium]
MPVFTGFVPMSELHLQEGFLRPFDNVGVFGWRGLVLLNDSKLHFTGPVIETPLYFLGFGVVPRQIYGGTDTVRPEGMTPLFDGETLNGWTVRGTADASVVDGVIRLTNGNGSLESDGKYGDFVLQLEYYTPVRPPGQGVNSGVFFRCIPGETMNGYECQILNSPSQRDFNNSMGGISATGGIHNRQTARNVGPKDGEWNYLTIAARGNRMAIWVNGIQVINWTDERAPHNNPRNGSRVEPGTIQFQGHDPDTEILFRNIRIREL